MFSTLWYFLGTGKRKFEMKNYLRIPEATKARNRFTELKECLQLNE